MNDKLVVQDAEIVESGTLAITPTAGMSTSERIAEFTKSIAQFQNLQVVVRKAAIGCTRARDWREWNGRLRPEVSACNSIAAMFGVRVTDKMSEKKNTNNGYVYITEATFEWPATGYRVEGVKGSCRSDDDIVGTRYGYNEETKQREKIMVPSTDVDEATVIKKAEANMMVNGIMTLFGLRNVTTEELAAAGITVGESQKTEFKNKLWEMSEPQKNILVKFHATEAELDKCKSNQDVTGLLNKLKVEKRQAPAQIEPAAAPPAGDGAYEQTVLDNLAELAEVLGFQPEAYKPKIDAAKAKGMTGLRSLQAGWVEMAKAAKKK